MKPTRPKLGTRQISARIGPEPSNIYRPILAWARNKWAYGRTPYNYNYNKNNEEEKKKITTC